MDRSSRSIRSAQKAALRLTGLASLICLAAGPSSALAEGEPAPKPVSPQTQEIGLLFNQTAKSGTLRARKGKDPDRYVLTLKSPSRQVIWSQDRPRRQSGDLSLGGFIEAWEGFGFAEDRPKAALSVPDGPGRADTAILTLGAPRLDAAKRKLRYPVRAEAKATGNLAHFEPDHDPADAVKRFGHATLFIDDARGQVVNGCVIQPYAQCPGADLRGASLRQANLRGANLARADLKAVDLFGVNVIGADLTQARFSGATLTYCDCLNADFSGADLTGVQADHMRALRSDFTGASLVGADLRTALFDSARFQRANLRSANLSDARMTGANMMFSDLRSANLTGAYVAAVSFGQADLTGATLTGAQYLADAQYFNTICPNGSTVTSPDYCRAS